MLRTTLSLVVTAFFLGSTQVNAATHTISQKDKKFDKTTLSVAKGDEIVFKNDEADITHNVYSITPGNSFDLKTQAPGKSSTVKIDGNFKGGEMTVECAIHPTMKLKVAIK